MRSLKRETRGISPVIATILLIAVTGVAAGVIAAFVAGLYATSPTVIAASADGALFDYDDGAAIENYKNANASCTVTIGSGRIRSVADPAYGGTTVTASCPSTGFTGTVSFPDNTDKWGYELKGSTDITFWSGADPPFDKITMTVSMYPDSKGRLGAGSCISIVLQPFGETDAHAEADNRMASARAWDEADTINITIAGRDSVSLVGYDGAYLLGMGWTA